MNPRVWSYLSKRYDYYYALLVGDGSLSPPRFRSPCQSSSPSEEELFNKYSLPSRSSSRVSVPMPPSDASSPPCVPDQLRHAPRCALSARIPCVVCGSDALLRCRRCQRAFYCSFACRSAHFPFHRYACSEPRDAATQPILAASRGSEAPAGREGIANAGNSCYLAAALQCLFSVSPLRRLLLSGRFARFLRADARAALSDPLRQLFVDLRFGRSPASAVVPRERGEA